MSRAARLLPVLLALVALAGCETLGYYRQGISGQWQFYGAREPIPQVLQRDGLSADERRRLEQVPQLLAFAREQLALPVKGQYRDYVQLESSAVAWSVFAAPELSLEPYRWCYLFGTLCMTYRGYFDVQAAQAYAQRLAAQGYDTHIGGVSAFSSLGLFDDPVTSVLTALPDDLMAMVLFHELAHARLYIRDDTAFNESFATAVGEEGLRRWLIARGEPPESPALHALRAERRLLTETALEIRERLAAAYGDATLDDEGKRARKREILAGAADDYDARCAAAAVACRGRGWFADGLNNARLNAVATYEHWVPAFDALLRAHGGDFAAFYRTVEALGKLPQEARDAVLRGLLPEPATP